MTIGQCVEEVRENSRWGAFHPHRCTRAAVVKVRVGYDGSPPSIMDLCKVHYKSFVQRYAPPKIEVLEGTAPEVKLKREYRFRYTTTKVVWAFSEAEARRKERLGPGAVLIDSDGREI